MSKIYGSPEQYEKKLDKVMARFKAQNYDYNWDRYGAWIQFEYKGNIYRFDHTVEKAKEKGLEIRYGSDWECEAGKGSGYDYEISLECTSCAYIFPIGHVRGINDFSPVLNKSFK